MGLVGVLVVHLLLVLVAEAQVLVEAYFCHDGLYVQPVLAPSLGSTLDKYDTSPGMVLALARHRAPWHPLSLSQHRLQSASPLSVFGATAAPTTPVS